MVDVSWGEYGELSGTRIHVRLYSALLHTASYVQARIFGEYGSALTGTTAAPGCNVCPKCLIQTLEPRTLVLPDSPFRGEKVGIAW